MGFVVRLLQGFGPGPINMGKDEERFCSSELFVRVLNNTININKSSRPSNNPVSLPLLNRPCVRSQVRTH